MGSLMGSLILAVMFLLIILLSGVSPDQLNAACSEHGGVQQIEITTWTALTNTTAGVVCKDGLVVGVK